jgi:diguanylate cyclase (GGDEF)-like protein/PAS domain S-box-containing protein
VKLAAQLCGSADAFIAVFDAEVLRVAAFAHARPSPHALPFATTVATSNGLLAGDDAAGVPLLGAGESIGALVVTAPSAMTAEREAALHSLAQEAVAQVELQRALAHTSELLAAQEEIAERERTWHRVLNHLPVGIFVLDRTGRPAFANTKAEQLLGRGAMPDVDPAQLAKRYPSRIAGTDREYPFERMPIVRALAGETSTVDDIELHHDDGVRNIEVFGCPLLDEHGNVEFAIAAFTDITERRALERALSREMLYVRLLHSVAVAANEAGSVVEAIGVALDRICELAGWPLGHCWMARPESSEMIAAPIWHNEEPRRFEGFVRGTNRMRLPFDEGLPGLVYTTRKPQMIVDVMKARHFTRRHHAEPPGIRSAFAFPVMTRGEVSAVLEFFAVDEKPLDPEFLVVMGHVGEQLGRVIERRRAEEALEDSERRYRELIEHSIDLIFTHDLEGRVLSANPAAATALGCASADELTTCSLRDFIVAEGHADLDEYLRRVNIDGRAEGIARIIGRDGRRRYWEYRSALRETPGAMSVACTARDVTERVEAEGQLARSERRYRNLFERNLAAVFRTTRSGRILDVNEAFIQLFGYESKEELLALPAGVFYPDDAARAHYLDRLGAVKALSNAEMRFRKKDGSLFWGLLSVSMLDDAEQGEQVIEGTLLDITERKESEERSAYRATHDALTGLPNRMLFADRLAQALAIAHRQNGGLAVAFIDLDDFKPVNDAFGHATGDWLLARVAERFSGALRETDTVARMGGDEFLALFIGVKDTEAAHAAAQKLITALEDPFEHQGRRIAISASVGVSIYPAHGHDGDMLIRHADQAMYRAKAAGRRAVEVFGQSAGDTDSGI